MAKSTSTISSIPHYGDVGENVRTVQIELQKIKANENLMIDGIFGAQTKKAIIKYQTENGLTIDGILGKQTLGRLGIAVTVQLHPNGYAPLSWEAQDPKRKVWSDYAHGIIDGLLDTKLSSCQDITTFRKDYNKLTRTQKINIWGEIICMIAKFESSWEPTSAMVETTMSIDLVTGKQVKSEGLLQLSYQDKRNYPSLPCRFNWDADKLLSDNDPNKTIFNPKINLEMGINILAQQVKNRGKIALEKNVYWAVLKVNGKYSKLDKIIPAVQGFGI